MTTGYRQALEAAGATVLDFECFGSYQGVWIACLSNGWIIDYYGSCTGCDAFEATFSRNEPSATELADFGQRYLMTGLIDNARIVDEVHQRSYNGDYSDMCRMLRRNGLTISEKEEEL